MSQHVIIIDIRYIRMCIQRYYIIVLLCTLNIYKTNKDNCVTSCY